MLEERVRSGLEIVGIVFLIIMAIFFPRLVLGTVLMVLLHLSLWIVILVAIVAFILDCVVLGRQEDVSSYGSYP